jgi:AraC-like DNA-binding protein
MPAIERFTVARRRVRMLGTGAVPVHHPGRASRAALREARDFMCDRLAEPMPLDLLAGRTGLSRYAFLRRFASTFGMTPHAYLVHLRLERAKELLVRADLPITDVCFEVGFSSLGSFSALFARRVGESPRRFRQRARRTLQVPDWVVSADVPFCFIERVAY